jgi:N,N'-diacetyllegionaminate synthase
MKLEIIAEIAQGFEGCLDQARLLVKASAKAGADAAKLQLIYADELATPDYKHYELFKKLEMSDEAWVSLGNYAKRFGISLHVDIFGGRSLKLAERIGVDAIKLHPTDIMNVGLLEQVAQSRIAKVLLGAGGAHMAELNCALEVLSAKRVVVLFGFQGYPTPTEANQISRVQALAGKISQKFPCSMVGFADHAQPDSPFRYALAATAIGAGARVLEKHLTLGQVMKLEDHESALNPDEFSEFVRVMRGCDEAIGATAGGEDFGMSESEKCYRNTIRRHVVSTRSLAKDSLLTPADLTLKRTSEENPLMDLVQAYSKRVRSDLLANAPVTAANLK